MTGGGTGDGGVATFAVSGTLRAPTGGDVQSTVIIACAWINDDCDDAKTLGFQVNASGASTPFEITGLERGLTYFVIFWKDMNASQTVDDGDFTAVMTDSDGNVRAITDTTTGTDTLMLVKRTVAPTSVPAALVGDWMVVNTNIGLTNRWSFRSDATATNEFILASVTCSGGGIATLSNGRISVTGNELVFTPTDSNRHYRCNGTSTITPFYANERRFSWRVGPSTRMAGNALFLTDLSAPENQRVEAEFQVL